YLLCQLYTPTKIREKMVRVSPGQAEATLCQIVLHSLLLVCSGAKLQGKLIYRKKLAIARRRWIVQIAQQCIELILIAHLQPYTHLQGTICMVASQQLAYPDQGGKITDIHRRKLPGGFCGMEEVARDKEGTEK